MSAQLLFIAVFLTVRAHNYLLRSVGSVYLFGQRDVINFVFFLTPLLPSYLSHDLPVSVASPVAMSMLISAANHNDYHEWIFVVPTPCTLPDRHTKKQHFKKSCKSKLCENCS